MKRNAEVEAQLKGKEAWYERQIAEQAAWGPRFRAREDPLRLARPCRVRQAAETFASVCVQRPLRLRPLQTSRRRLSTDLTPGTDQAALSAISRS